MFKLKKKAAAPAPAPAAADAPAAAGASASASSAAAPAPAAGGVSLLTIGGGGRAKAGGATKLSAAERRVQNGETASCGSPAREARPRGRSVSPTPRGVARCHRITM